MKIGIANDHRGVYLKEKLMEYLEHSGHEVINYGADVTEGVDFPIFAKKLGNGVLNKEVDYGIAICGTGIGMSIALNKMKGIYCAKISNISEVVLCREHNNANVIAISADTNLELVKSMVDKFIVTSFSNVEKYAKRNDMIKEIENNG